MRNSVFFLFLLFLPFGSINSQNLIPNGDFESGDIPCQSPNVFDHQLLLDNWSAASGSSLFYNRVECELNRNGRPYLPHSGNGDLVISGASEVNGLMTSSFVFNTFTEPLEAGTAYYLEFYGKSEGIYHVAEEDFRDCDINPPKDITFYLGGEKEEFGIERTFGKHLTTDAWLTGEFEKIIFKGGVRIYSAETAWQKFSTCFEAKGGERKLGISGPIRFFNGSPPCELITDEQLDTFTAEAFIINRFFHFFNYQIDDIGLYKIPNELVAKDTICQYQFNKVNLLELLPESPIYKEASFLWEDGSDEVIRDFEDGGIYNISVILPCKTIPLRLNIETQTCPSPVYMPNVFSPNFDGINDEFKPYFSNYYELNHYLFSIYDRWGNLVFSTTDSSKGWQGQGNGQKSGNTTYLWILEYQFIGFSKLELKTGMVQVMQ